MFDLVENAGRPAVFLVGVGGAGCETVRVARSAAMSDVARYVLIDGSVAILYFGEPDGGPERSPECAVVEATPQRRVMGHLQLVSDRVPKLLDQAQAVMTGGQIILVVLDMRDSGEWAMAQQVAQAACRQAAIVLGIAIVPPEIADSRKETATQVAALIENGLSAVVVPEYLLPQVSSREREGGLDAAASVLFECHACVARGLISPSLWEAVFQDVRMFLLGGGRCRVGWGAASGEDRVLRAVEAAIAHPLLGMHALLTARRVLVCVRAGRGNLREDEAREVMSTLQAVAGPETGIVVSAQYDEAMGEALRVSILAREYG